MKRIPYLSTLLKTLIAVCKVIDVAKAPIRRFVPTESLAAYDDACEKISNACDVIRAIDYLDDNPATNPPFGQH